jgi:hypothetical protein
MLRVRENGVVVPRHNVGMLRPVRGQLLVHDKRFPDINRVSRVAEFLIDGAETLTLLDANLVHATQEMLVLTGFERAYVNTELTDFAQTWVLSECVGETPEGSRGPPFPR